MEQNLYQGAVLLLFTGVVLLIGGSVSEGTQGLSPFGVALILTSGIALLLGAIRRRRDSGR